MKSWTMVLMIVAILLAVVCGSSRANVKVSVVKSWGDVPVFRELTDNWSAYGVVPVTIDTSLMEARNFTYQDLVNTDADVIWISDPAGHPFSTGPGQYSAAEIQAVRDYTVAGHSILGTFLMFRYYEAGYPAIDNRPLADIFGLRSVHFDYNTGSVTASQRFDILVDHPLFNDIADPYVSSGYAQAQVPADDKRWDASDLGSARLLAQTDDARGIITWYQTDAYHAIYVSEMVEYYGSTVDTQFLYNALTVPEPATALFLALGTFAALHRRREA